MTWAERATRRLDETGRRAGAARRRVIELLGAESCAVTALEIDQRLPEIGRASVYRTLDQLERLHMVQRVDIGGGAAAYERLDPDAHHHHLVCLGCGRLVPFHDGRLEGAIAAISEESEFEVESHDVVLRGRCRSCRDAANGA
jgi:Fur family ferric uptake transcriptional regulator